ncbi:MAG: ATP-binding protein, partial [Endomicrobiia bacterium]
EDELLEQTVKNISEIMGISKVAIILRNETFGDYEIMAEVGLDEKNIKISGESELVSWLIKNKTFLVMGEIEKILSKSEIEKIEKDLAPLDVSICVPLIFRDELIGILTLGEKDSREVFSHWDFELLETLAKDLAFAISYKRLEFRIRQADRLISLGTLAAGIAHEIRNPLSSVQTFLQLLPEKYSDEDFRDNFSKIVSKDVTRIEKIIESILTLARFNTSIFYQVNIVEIIEETLVLLENDIKKNSIKVIKVFNDVPNVMGDREQLKQVFMNIFLNDIQAMNNSKEKILKISTQLKENLLSSQFNGNRKYVQIEISDNGHGIEKKILNRIFDPFFTTKPTGTGLGLSIAHRIIDEHRGTIEVTSELGKGTTFYINLPVEIKNVGKT